MHPEELRIEASRAQLAAWLFVPPSPRAAVLVVHGIHADRSKMLGRAELLWRDGYAVLLPDLRAHGESSGSAITYGYLEARDAQVALQYLGGRFPELPLGAIGVSLGGAALALAEHDARAQAMVLEAVFPTITEALDNRLARRVGPLSRFLTPLLLLQLRPRLGVSQDDLRPIDSIRALGCPVLIVSGAADRYTTAEQTRALFTAASEPKEIWLVPGAAHVDLLRHDPEGYRLRVLGFLDRYLAPARKSPTY